MFERKLKRKILMDNFQKKQQIKNKMNSIYNILNLT